MADGNILDVLSKPAAADPDFYNKGLQNLNALRDTQAKQAIADITQQSIDPQTGQVDPAKFNLLISQDRRAAWAGLPAMQAQGQAARSQSDAGTAQVNYAAAGMKLMGQSAMTVAQNPSDDNVNASFDNLAAHGFPADRVASERARWLAMSPAERQNNAYRIGLQSLDQLHQVVGQTTGVNVGGQIVPLTVTQPTPRGPGGIVQGPGAVTTTASPDTVVGMPDLVVPATADDVKNGLASQPGQMIHISGADRIKRYGYTRLLPPGAQEVPGTGGGGGGGGPGVVGADGKPVSPANPPRLLNVPNQPPAPAPAGYQGTGTGTAADTTPIYQPPAGAPPAAPAAPQQPPRAAAPPVVSTSPTLRGPGSPAVPPGQDSGWPGPRAALQGGVPVASANPLIAPTVGTPGPPSPLVPGDVNAILGGMNRARGAPTRGTQVAGASFATGPGYDEQTTAKVSQDRLASDTALAANYASNIFPQTQALSLLGRGMTTAPTTDLINEMKGWAGGVVRSMGGSGVFDSTKEYDELHKWLSQIVAGNPVAQGSDARLAQVLSGNANTGIHELASADMMKAGIALMRMNATASNEWVNNPAVQRQYGYYANYLRDFNKTVDPRAFAWDMYNPTQKKDLIDDLNKHRNDPSYAQRLENSLQMVRRGGYMGEIRAMPGG